MVCAPRDLESCSCPPIGPSDSGRRFTSESPWVPKGLTQLPCGAEFLSQYFVKWVGESGKELKLKKKERIA